jgi:hypothetical protein
MTLWTFAATILPPLLAALIASGLGAAALSPRITTGSVVPVALFGLLLFVAMMTFKRARGWNAGLLVAVSFAAGGVVTWLFEDRIGGSWLGAVSAAVLILAISAVAGRRVGPRLAGIGAWLWLLSWIYLFGWVVVAVLHLPPGWILAWAAGGLVVYGGLSATWFAGFDPVPADPSGTAWAVDLYLLGLNLAIAARVLLASAG